MHSSETHSDGTPAEHQKRQPPTRAELLEEDVARYFKDGISDEEDHESNGKLVVRHAGGVLQVIIGRVIEDFGVADVSAVKEAQEVDGRAEGDDAEVLLEDEFLFLGS